LVLVRGRVAPHREVDVGVAVPRFFEPQRDSFSQPRLMLALGELVGISAVSEFVGNLDERATLLADRIDGDAPRERRAGGMRQPRNGRALAALGPISIPRGVGVVVAFAERLRRRVGPEPAVRHGLRE
jgi:hypothetical protein